MKPLPPCPWKSVHLGQRQCQSQSQCQCRQGDTRWDKKEVIKCQKTDETHGKGHYKSSN